MRNSILAIMISLCSVSTMAQSSSSRFGVTGRKTRQNYVEGKKYYSPQGEDWDVNPIELTMTQLPDDPVQKVHRIQVELPGLPPLIATKAYDLDRNTYRFVSLKTSADSTDSYSASFSDISGSLTLIEGLNPLRGQKGPRRRIARVWLEYNFTNLQNEKLHTIIELIGKQIFGSETPYDVPEMPLQMPDYFSWPKQVILTPDG